MEKNNQIYKEWFEKANEDELAGEEVLKNPHLYAPACFHFHQTAEKYLKGFLVFNSNGYPKSHDLLELASLIADLAPDIMNLEEELLLLNDYYIETRYPGDYPEFSLKDAEDARKAAREVKDFILIETQK